MFFGVLLFTLLILAVLIGVYCIYLVNLRDLLREVNPVNQKMPPNNVFLMLIPLFNLGYVFIMYPNVTKSLKAEFEDRGLPEIDQSLKGLGLALAILFVSNTVMRQVSEDLGSLLSLGWLIVWIIYWVKSAAIKKYLRENKGNGNFNLRENDLLD